MLDLINFISQSSTFATQQNPLSTGAENFGKVNPEDGALFNEKVNGNVESKKTDEVLIKPESLGDKILANMSNMDKTYQTLFDKEQHPVISKDISVDNSAFELKDHAPYQNLTSMLDLVKETHAWAMRVSMWSTQLNLLTTTVSKSTGGLETLFRNGGS